MTKFIAILSLILLAAFIFWLLQPIKRASPQSTLTERYLKALEDTSKTMDKDPTHVQLNQDRIIDLFTHYEVDLLSKNVGKVYAKDTYFRDAFKEFSRAEQITPYLVHGLHAVSYCGFEFQPTVFHEGDYFFRWTMLVSLKRSKSNELVKSIGMSHMRFNEQGKVIFHQDYWDPTDLVYHQIPIANRLINWVKGRM